MKPEIPAYPIGKLKLRESLGLMGLAPVMEMEWGLKSKAMIRELLKEQPNPFTMTIQANPNEWEGSLVAGSFQLLNKGLPLLQEGDDRSTVQILHRSHGPEGGLVG